MTRNSQVRRQLRHVRLRKKVAGTASVPRFCVSLTANNMYCQFIDDDAGVTLASSSTLSPEFKALNLKRNVEAAAALGKLAERLLVKVLSRLGTVRLDFRNIKSNAAAFVFVIIFYEYGVEPFAQSAEFFCHQRFSFAMISSASSVYAKLPLQFLS